MEVHQELQALNTAQPGRSAGPVEALSSWRRDLSIGEAAGVAVEGAADAELAATGVGIVALAAEAAGFTVKFFINKDDKNREAYTQQFVQRASQKYPGYNVVICHPNHKVSGANIHQHYELPMTVGTCGYDIYFSQKGKQFTFVNQGMEVL
jgi:hypothetical protein